MRQQDVAECKASPALANGKKPQKWAFLVFLNT
jgi:hypothetical protein